jgi:hypothetical protein
VSLIRVLGLIALLTPRILHLSLLFRGQPRVPTIGIVSFRVL